MVKSYLTNRKVSFAQEELVVKKTCTKECPQGSVLGPLLWSLTITQLLKKQWPDEVKLMPYADDLTVVVNSHSRSILIKTAQKVMEEIKALADTYKLEISAEKSKVMINKPSKPAIVPRTSYASSVWADRLELAKFKRPHISVYGTFSRIIAKAYNSVSYAPRPSKQCSEASG